MRGGICPGCGSGKGIRRGAAKERKKSGSRSSGKGILWLVLAVLSMVFEMSLLPVFILLLVWGVMQVTYALECIRLGKRN